MLNKGKSDVPLYSTAQRCCLLHPDKAKLFAEDFPKKHKHKHNLFLTITIELHKCNKNGTVTLKY